MKTIMISKMKLVIFLVVAVVMNCIAATSITAKADLSNTAPINPGSSCPQAKYRAHVQSIGWQSWVSGGTTAGTVGQSKRLEAFNIKLTDAKGSSAIEYRANVQNSGWQSWVGSNGLAGTTGKALGIQAIQIRLKGDYAKKYDVLYRVHVEKMGWLGWAKNGNSAGSTGCTLNVQAMEVVVVAKDSYNKKLGTAYITKPSISYSAHVQSIGWQAAVGENATAGTVGMSKRMEALKINLMDFEGNNGVLFRTHVSGTGWTGWTSSGKVSGTEGKSKAIEAVQIKLTSQLSQCYDIYYRMHVAKKGWLGWAKNGAMAGTTGGSIAGQAIEIKIVKKGTAVNTGGQAYYDESLGVKLRQSDVFLKQNTSTSCTLSSAAMLLRRKAIVDNRSDWKSITEAAMRGTAYSSGGLLGAFTYANMHVSRISVKTDASYYIDYLKNHPEGIVIYYYGPEGTGGSGMHAILLTDYRDGKFYCADPSGNAATGEILLTSSTLPNAEYTGKTTQEGILSAINYCWVVD